jgi:hypothetical protein
MEHPFITGLDEMSLDDLGKRIGDLHKKLSFAQRTGNGYLCDQIRLALNSYQAKHQQKLSELYSPKSGEDDNFDSKINIS